MKRVIFAALLVMATVPASAQYYQRGGQNNYGTGSNSNSHYVQPHYNNNGSYVGGHYRTNPNSTQSDNYGASGNYNPHNGTYGGQRRSNGW